jgi:hypothetical protein
VLCPDSTQEECTYNSRRWFCIFHIGYLNLSCAIAGARLGRLLQDVIEVALGGAVASPFRTQGRPLPHFSQGGEQLAVQFLRASSFHLGFDDELVAIFPDRALRSELGKSLPDRACVRAVDVGLSLKVMLGAPACLSEIVDLRLVRNDNSASPLASVAKRIPTHDRRHP